MSTSTSRRTSSGRVAATAMAVSPPSDWPTTASASGASWVSAEATAPALVSAR